MEFLPLSLPEASMLLMGLNIQAHLRAYLRHVPHAILIWSTFVLLLQGLRHRTIPLMVVGFHGATLLILAMFWPEIVPFGRGSWTMVAPDQVGSYAAMQDEQAIVKTAQDTGWGDTPVLLTPGFKLLLKPMVDFPLAMGRLLNSQTHRPFASLLPAQWLLGVDLTTEINASLADWVHNCYLPVLTGTIEGQEGRTVDELLPWDHSPLRRGLETRTVKPGAQTGITWWRSPTSDGTVRCDVYLDAVEQRTQEWLYELRSPNGTPLSEVFARELPLDRRQQARFLIYREMMKAGGPAVPAPSLTGQYALLRGIGVVGSVMQGGVGGLFKGWLGLGTGAAKGAAEGVGNELQRVIDGLSGVIRVAMVLTWTAPYVVGIINMVMIGLFPIVVLWSCLPGMQFQPLAQFFVALALNNSASFCWAMADLAGRLAGAQTPALGPDGSMDRVITQWAASGTWVASITAIGMVLIPFVYAALYFLAFRSVQALWRGGAA